jgi:alpha-tubulin suppressor-like RCC1 family protein
VFSWGSGYKDSRRGLVPPVLGLGHAEGRTLPEVISSLESMHIIDIASGWDHCLALDAKKRVLSWGSGQNGLSASISLLITRQASLDTDQKRIFPPPV